MNIKKIINSPATLSFLLLIQIILHLFYFKIQEFDLPNSTKKLVIDTIKNEISFNPKCVNENCKKEVKNLENVLDDISYANQLGRLDTISSLVAAFALVLGLGAIAGFMHIKDTSEGIAEREAKKWLDGEGIRTIEKWLNREEGIRVIETAIENYMKKKDSSETNQDTEKLKTENPQANFGPLSELRLSDFLKK